MSGLKMINFSIFSLTFLIVIILLGWKDLMKMIYKKTGITLTTFSEKMNINMNLVSDTFFKKDNEEY